MFKKNTQNLKKLIWQNSLLALVLLLSMNISGQVIGQELLVNPGINSATGPNSTTPDTGVNGSGNMPTHLGGWGTGANGAYAQASTANGDCHSADRMFKFFKKNQAHVTQTVTLPAGTYDWSFYTKWEALVNWDNEGDVTPKFLIMTDDDEDGSWTAVQTTITQQPTEVDSWVQQTGTYSTDTERQVRIKFSKNGGPTDVPTNLNQSMFIDDVSLTLKSLPPPSVDNTNLADLTIDGTTITGFTSQGTTYDIELAPDKTDVPTVVAITTNPNATSVITNATSIPGTTSIVITAEDGTTQSTVEINFTVQTLTFGQEFLVNPGINTATGVDSTTPDTGVDGGGNFPVLGGWGSGATGAYASASTANGDCHSADRMFKLFKVGGTSGQFVTQTVTLPAGNFNWSFWTKWAALVNWDNEGDVTPKFTIMTDDDGDGSWTAVQTTITTQPTATDTWIQQLGTFENDIERQVRIKFSKNGGTSSAPSNLNQLMFIDDVSLTYSGTLSISEEELMSLSIFPSPAKNVISIKGVENIKSIKVYSILGALEKEVFKTNQIDVSELSSGIHLVKVDNGTIFSKKIIKQ
jgi:hypothetical protein